jgi:hypothetical protein
MMKALIFFAAGLVSANASNAQADKVACKTIEKKATLTTIAFDKLKEEAKKSNIVYRLTNQAHNNSAAFDISELSDLKVVDIKCGAAAADCNTAAGTTFKVYFLHKGTEEAAKEVTGECLSEEVAKLMPSNTAAIVLFSVLGGLILLGGAGYGIYHWYINRQN